MKKLFAGVASIIFISFIFLVSYEFGLRRGYSEGFRDTADTVLTIMRNQAKSDTSVSKVVVINPDTHVFVLSKKQLLKSRK